MANIIGYRFHPTDEELVNYYLMHKNLGHESRVRNAINEINIGRLDPWDMPSHSKIQSDDDRNVWYFFCRSNRFSNRSTRARRTTKSGYWKATGRDRKIRVPGSSRPEVIGTKKTSVFYKGRVPNGARTSWVVHEYHPSITPPNKRTYVICKLKNKEEEKNPMPTSGGVEATHPPPPDSENHATVDSTHEALVQGEDSQLESVYKYNGFDDYLGFYWNEKEEGISPLDLRHLIDSSNNHNAPPSQEISPSDFQYLVDEIDEQEDEFVNSLLADQDDSSAAENTSVEAETLDSWLSISSSVNDGSTTEKDQEQLLKRESSFGSGSFDSVSHPKLIHFAAEECPGNSQLQGNLLEKGASGKKVETPTQAPPYTSTKDSEYNYSEFISNPSTKDTKQVIHEKYFKNKKQSIHENCRFDSTTGNRHCSLIELLLDDFQITVTLKIPLHGAGVSLKTFTERILRIFVNHLMQIPVEMFTDNYSRENPYPIRKEPAKLITRCTLSTFIHCKASKDSLIPINPLSQKHQIVRKYKHLKLANVRKFKRMKRTTRCTNLTYPKQKVFKYFEEHMLDSSSFNQAKSLLKHP